MPHPPAHSSNHFAIYAPVNRASMEAWNRLVSCHCCAHWFTPRLATNKVLHDAHHLLAGIEHDGRVGAWMFTGWKLVDLCDFRVRLKAEYQGGNRDLYREELILRSSK